MHPPRDFYICQRERERERERERDFDIYQMLVGFDPGGITRTRRRPRKHRTT